MSVSTSSKESPISPLNSIIRHLYLFPLFQGLDIDAKPNLRYISPPFFPDPLTPSALADYRQLVFINVVQGMKLIIDAMDAWEMSTSADNREYITLIDNALDINEGEPFPSVYVEGLTSLWKDPEVQKAYERGNEMALPENMP